LPHEHPKLAVTATVIAGDFADQLEKANERSRRVLLEAKPMIEANVSHTANVSSDTKPGTSNGHKPSVPDEDLDGGDGPQRSMMVIIRTTTEKNTSAENTSPIILPSCSGHSVYSPKYAICSPSGVAKAYHSRSSCIDRVRPT
jgi:hypothetical protein